MHWHCGGMKTKEFYLKLLDQNLVFEVYVEDGSEKTIEVQGKVVGVTVYIPELRPCTGTCKGYWTRPADFILDSGQVVSNNSIKDLREVE